MKALYGLFFSLERSKRLTTILEEVGALEVKMLTKKNNKPNSSWQDKQEN
jgi:hypothetical protein